MFFSKEHIKTLDSASQRAMNQQWKQFYQPRRQATAADFEKSLLQVNAGVSPAQAYQEFDSRTMLEAVPAGEHETWRRMVSGGSVINGIGRLVSTSPRTNELERGTVSLFGNTGANLDNIQTTYQSTVIPLFEKAVTQQWREFAATQQDGYDVLVPLMREQERSMIATVNDYLWAGDASITFNDSLGNSATWLGLRNDPTVGTYSLTVDMTSNAVTTEQKYNEFKVARDVLRVSNLLSGDVSVAVSREIMSAFETPYSTADATYGMLKDMLLKLSGIGEIYEDPELSGNQMLFAKFSQDGTHAVTGLGLSSFKAQRQDIDSPHIWRKMLAQGFISKNTAAGRKTALYCS